MTREYHLVSSGVKKIVCQRFFLSTLSVNEKRIRNVLSASSDAGFFELDKRGKHENHVNKSVAEEAVVAHISKFKTVDSHYVRQTAKAQYLPEELNVKEMHRMYVEDHNGVGNVENYKFYHSIFKQRFNLKFQRNKKDQCDKCEGFRNTPVENKTADMIIDHDKHIDEKDSAGDLKAEMKRLGENDNVVSSAFDLEKVLLAPHGQTSSFYYSKRLKIHNFTVTDITNMETFCYVWHEGEAAKGSCEVGSCLQKYLGQTDATKVNLFSDRCGGQNSNRPTIVAIHDAFYKSKIEELTMNFLVTGHSQNENDTAHSNIEQAVRKRKLYTPDQWRTAIQFAFQPGKVVVNSLRTEDVINFKCPESFPEYKAMLKDTTTENDIEVKNRKDAKVYWSKIMQYKFVRDQPDKLFYKYFYSSPGYKYTTIYNKGLTTRSSKAPTRQRLYEKAIGIQPSKKEALLKLCRQDLIPQEHWNFFQSLIVNGKNNDDSDTDNEE